MRGGWKTYIFGMLVVIFKKSKGDTVPFNVVWKKIKGATLWTKKLC